MKHSFFLLACVLSLVSLLAATALAQKPKPKLPEYTSVKELADDVDLKRDFNIQGEYVYTVNNFPCGLNFIARGTGTFDLVIFPGGLPGAGWSRGIPRFFGKAVWDGEKDRLIVDLEEIEDDGKRRGLKEEDNLPVHYELEVRKGQLLFKLPDQDEMQTIEKVRRKSPDLGRTAPEGAIVLLNEGQLNESMWIKGEINEKAKTLWADAETKPFEKRPYRLHLEFMLSYMPEARGQARANSGVYIDDVYECQILDSFGLDGKNNECGGFYLYAVPKVNMCFPPLQWQSYDIEFDPAKFDADGVKTADARITMKHNGVVIHEGFSPPKETPGRKQEGPKARGLYLQGHGNKVQFRNIWLQYR